MRTSTSLWHNRNEIPLPPPPAGFFLPSRPHTSPPAGISGHAPTPPSRQAFLLPACLAARPSPHAPHPAVAARHTAPTAPDRLFFIALPAHPTPRRAFPATPALAHHDRLFPRPRRDFSCLPARTPRPRRAFPATTQPRQAGRLFFSPHASPPALRRMPFTRRSLPPSTAFFFLWRLFRLCRTGMIYSQKTFYF
jgi:hypothetical protein